MLAGPQGKRNVPTGRAGTLPRQGRAQETAGPYEVISALGRRDRYILAVLGGAVDVEILESCCAAPLPCVRRFRCRALAYHIAKVPLWGTLLGSRHQFRHAGHV